jgi:hypothetical protein
MFLGLPGTSWSLLEPPGWILLARFSWRFLRSYVGSSILGGFVRDKLEFMTISGSYE